MEHVDVYKAFSHFIWYCTLTKFQNQDPQKSQERLNATTFKNLQKYQYCYNDWRISEQIPRFITPP